DVNGAVGAGRLQMTWSFSRNLHQRATIDRVAGDFIAALRELIAHCSSPAAGRVTRPEAESEEADVAEPMPTRNLFGIPGLIRLGTGASDSAIFCLSPGTTTSVRAYQTIGDRLGATSFGVQIGYEMGRYTTTVERMADQCIARMRQARPEGPYHLLGWSMGGVVAFEVATKLVEQGHEVGLLMLLEPRRLSLGRKFTELIGEQEARGAAQAKSTFKDGLKLTTAMMRSVETPQQANGWSGRLRQILVDLDLPNPDDLLELPAKDLHTLLRQLVSDTEAAETYVPRRRAQEAVLVVSSEGADASEERPSSATGVSLADYLEDWQTLIGGELTTHFVPGDHESLVRDPSARQVAALCNSYLGL
ncbi:MAG TPA: thioesterase domain-containing protein, partial [Actinomycetota bacterium]|nr:thioesterase domain-containing protein [Actinomycetota bacterium]